MLLSANAGWTWQKMKFGRVRPWCIKNFLNIAYATVCNCGSHETVLQGRNEDGSYKTAIAKTYPPPLCEYLVEGILHNPKCKEIEAFDVWDADNEACRELAEYHFPMDPFASTVFDDVGYVPDYHARQ